ncbi:MAG: GNAT family N-acetyltransferase [Cypionkella sp.]|uniref:GNAT family N-acetyltransferase n=1 Tax=Cypionkella sp. TaxID=2811411 RepID=UPI002AB8FD08|nr:GNAT family N-acetyltransferase [Cypionkella sp.]MDZ4312114.1 GNAT family N-acetyltransferase [Cypionkella sp.]
MGKSVRVKSFELVATDIASVDTHLLHALSAGVGWSHRPDDWDFLRQVGQGIAVVDEIGRVFGSAMWFPQSEDFATVGLVITTHRAQAQGAGRWLMAQVMDRCKARNLTLNSTKAAYPLYLSLGFEKEAIVFMHCGKVSGLPAVASTDGTLTEVSAAQIDEITACDTQAFGVNRSRVLAQLSKISVTCVLRRSGEVVGYAMRRPFGGLQVIGPIVAGNDDDAIQLATWHLKALKGRQVRIDTREEKGPFTDLLTHCGLALTETTITMSKGRRFLNRSATAPWVYALAGHALS